MIYISKDETKRYHMDVTNIKRVKTTCRSLDINHECNVQIDDDIDIILDTISEDIQIPHDNYVLIDYKVEDGRLTQTIEPILSTA